MAALPIHHGALVLVGDGEKAIFLRNVGNVKLKLAIERVLEQENPPTHEQGTDRPGRKPGGDGLSTSAVGETDWHQIAEERFADEISKALFRLAHAHRFDELVVIAPPKVLGRLRNAFHKEVVDRIAAEVPKELTTHSLPEIEKALSNLQRESLQ